MRGTKRTIARRHYRELVRKEIVDGRRHDLTGGGLVRNAGGWTALKTMCRSESRINGDERMLGNGDFVESVLKSAQDAQLPASVIFIK